VEGVAQTTCADSFSETPVDFSVDFELTAQNQTFGELKIAVDSVEQIAAFVAEIAAVVAVVEMVLAVVEQIVAEEKIAVEEQTVAVEQTVVEIEAVQISFAVAAIVPRSVDQEFVGVVSISDQLIG